MKAHSRCLLAVPDYCLDNEVRAFHLCALIQQYMSLVFRLCTLAYLYVDTLLQEEKGRQLFMIIPITELFPMISM